MKEFLFKVRLSDNEANVACYTCHAESDVAARDTMKGIFERRHLTVMEILYEKEIPKFKSRAEDRRWWHKHGGNQEVS